MSARRARSVLLVGPVSGGPISGGIENGIELLLRSRLAGDCGLVLFNSYRARDPARGWTARLQNEAGTYSRFVATLARRRPGVVHVKASEGPNFLQGLLYVALVFVLIGELLSSYLTVATGFPA